MLRRSKAKQQARRQSEGPVLNEEDEQFLRNATDESRPPPLPESPAVITEGKVTGEEPVGKDPQIALMNGAQDIPLPETPDEQTEESTDTEAGKGKSKQGKSRFNPLSYFQRRKSKATVEKEAGPEGAKENTTDAEEQEDITATLDKLNLAAINNRVFSLSQESQELLQKFNLIVKDLINGAPTAYDDLDRLLTGSEQQLKKMFGTMPPFLQSLIRSLPVKVATSLAPEILAAASEKPGADAAATAAATASAEEDTKGKEKEKKSRYPSLKTLVAQQGAVAGMLRSILNFLRLRWPAFMGSSNILLSMALFVLLFVFWYCHKRGRETRLSREQAEIMGVSEASDVEASDLEASTADVKGQSEKTEATTDSPQAIGLKDQEDIKSSPAREPETDAAKAPESAASAILSAPLPAEVPLPSPDEKEKGESKQA
ncbi:hypothetical protein L228DRAFT_38892 [Xylona heveae TC161]|uniref:Ring-like domain-containing protein n=1 Tax=Xylona heveae (strain CBS 132557 / TC161) TaxID=1328760 RepID=A0A164ZYA5_XYLHT|nr:hypothetical protein L228DRAFT_38892 [Xylona heveae TC161]KZF19693.1 hypothetical protein L228DRAFT_38892 [Xylona heveae TC161]